VDYGTWINITDKSENVHLFINYVTFQCTDFNHFIKRLDFLTYDILLLTCKPRWHMQMDSDKDNSV